MSDQRWDPWKATAIGMALLMATAMVTGLVVANWTGPRPLDSMANVGPAQALRPAPARPPSTSAAVPLRPDPAPAAVTAPPPAVVAACNELAARQTETRDKIGEAVKDATIGAGFGAGGSTGTLYGLREHKRHDKRYREAYAACMRSRGYAS